MLGDVSVIRRQFAICILRFSFCIPSRRHSSILLLAGATCFCDESAASAAERATREIYVPFSDLHVILQQQPKRVLLSREEYDDLVKKAKKSPETHAPQPAVIVSADYADCRRRSKGGDPRHAGDRRSRRRTARLAVGHRQRRA